VPDAVTDADVERAHNTYWVALQRLLDEGDTRLDEPARKNVLRKVLQDFAGKSTLTTGQGS
jgi:hypothetical protein